jgi:hypothetical protein
MSPGGVGKGVDPMMIRGAFGVAAGDDPVRAIQDAAAAARRSAGDSAPKAALVLVAGGTGVSGLGRAAWEATGGVPVAGASVAAILTDAGRLEAGAAVMCFYGDTLSPSAICVGRPMGLAAATERVGRLILAGASERRHFPRGVALAFASPVTESLADGFLVRWRHLAGPKLRTVISAAAGQPLCAPGAAEPGTLAVLCLEGAYKSGVGFTGAPGPGESTADPATLVHGAADAATTAVKRLEGQPVRAALIVESAARYAGLGAAVRDEWLAMREQIGLDVPCVGWLTTAEGAYGRGATAGDTGSVIVVALGEAVPLAPAAA